MLEWTYITNRIVQDELFNQIDNNHHSDFSVIRLNFNKLKLIRMN